MGACRVYVDAGLDDVVRFAPEGVLVGGAPSQRGSTHRTAPFGSLSAGGSCVDVFISVFGWIGSNEAVLSGIAALIVIVGVLFTPLGRGLRALLRHDEGGSSAAPATPVVPGTGARTDAHSDPPGPGASAPAVSDAPRATSAPSPAHSATPAPVLDRPSIAVLPFLNGSGEPEQEFLADGLTEEVILGLSRIKQLFVIARNSSFTYKGQAPDPQRVSRELGVRYVLEGSVRRHGERVRVSAQLVDATTRGTAWAERFERPLASIVELDDEMTEAIVAALLPALRRAEAERARRAAPEDLTAWALVNRAWVAVQSDLGSREAALSAVEACEEALRREPDYALAHAVLGHARSLLVREGTADAGEADAAIRRALQLSDDDPLVHQCHAALAGNLGRTAEGVRAWERALALDPNSAGARAGLGIARIYLREPEAALASIDQALRLSPRDPLTYHWLANRALACVLLERWDEALAAAEASVERTASQVGCLVQAAALAHAGRDAEAHQAWAELRRRVPGISIGRLSVLVRALLPEGRDGETLQRAIERAAAEGPPPAV